MIPNFTGQFQPSNRLGSGTQNRNQNGGAQQYLNEQDMIKLRVTLNSKINVKRKENKLDRIMRCRRGDQIAQQICLQGIQSKHEVAFGKILSNKMLVYQNVELIDFEFSHIKFLQIPTQQEAIEGFTKAFEEMLNNSQYSRYFSDQQNSFGPSFTHASFGFKQKGQNSEVFNISVLLIQMSMGIYVIAESKSEAVNNVDQQFKMLIGSIKERNLYPELVIIDQGKSTELKIGVNQIYFDPNQSDEIKIWFFDHEFLSSNPVAKVEKVHIYASQIMNHTSMPKYGEGQRVHQNFNPEQHGLSLIFKDNLPQNYRGLEMSLFQAVQTQNLYDTLLRTSSNVQQRLRLGQKSSLRPGTSQIPSISSSNQVIQPKKTKAQELREQKAREIRMRNDNTNSQFSNVAIPLGAPAPPQSSCFPPSNQVPNQNPPPQQTSLQTNFFSKPQNALANPFSNPNKDAGKAPFGQNNSFQSSFGQPKSQMTFNLTQQNQNQQMPNQPALNFNPTASFSNPQQFQNQTQNQPQKSTFGGFQQTNNQFQNVTSSNLNGQQPAQINPFKPPTPQASSFKPQNDNQAFGNNGGFFGQNSLQQSNISSFAPPSNNFNSQIQSSGGSLQQKMTFTQTHNQIQVPQNFQQPVQQQQQLPVQQQQNCNQVFDQSMQQPLQFNFGQSVVQAPPAQQMQMQSYDQKTRTTWNNCQPEQCNQGLHLLNAQQLDVFNTLKPHLKTKIKEQKLIEYLLDLKNQNYTEEQISVIWQLIANQPLKFLESVEMAHFDFSIDEQLVEKKELDPQTKLWQEFHEKILFQCDLGLFLLRISDTYGFKTGTINEESYNEALQSVISIFKKWQSNSQYYTDSVETVRQNICQMILERLTIKEKSPQNDCFRLFYQEHLEAQRLGSHSNRLDFVLKLRDIKYNLHRMVFQSGSKFFDDLIRSNIENQRGNYNRSHNQFEVLKLILPKWMQPQAFEMFIKYLYLGQIQNGSNFETLYEFYKIAYNFRDYILENLIVVQHLIPELTLKDSIYCIQELQKIQNDSQRKSKILLRDYCLFMIAKNLTQAIRMGILERISTENMHEIIQTSMLFLKGDGENSGMVEVKDILEFAAQYFGKNLSIVDLMTKVNKKRRMCLAFDHQQVLKIQQILKEIPEDGGSKVFELISTDPFKMNAASQNNMVSQMIDSYLGCNLSSTENEGSQERQDSQRQKLNEKTFMIQKNDDFQMRDSLPSWYDYNQYMTKQTWSPNKNITLDEKDQKYVTRTSEIESRYEQTILIDWLKKQYKEGHAQEKGLTVFSPAFNTSRRSWHLKLDFDQNKNMSLYIVEKGAPTEFQETNSNINMPNFSSMMIEMTISNKKLGQKLIPIFYSFAHGTHQIIGQKNVLNIGQFDENIDIKVYMRELTLNSCIMTHLCYNISDELSRSSHDRNGVLDLPFPIAYQLVMSNHLKVTNENDALSFVFNYLEQNQTTVGTNLLSQALRYNFICFRKMLSAIRRNEQIRSSTIFVSRMRFELDCRVNIIQQNEKELQTGFLMQSTQCQSNSNPQNGEEGVHVQRLYFNTLDIGTQGRIKISNETDIKILINEVLQWVCTATVTQSQPSISNYRNRRRSRDDNDLDRTKFERNRDPKDSRIADYNARRVESTAVHPLFPSTRENLNNQRVASPRRNNVPNFLNRNTNKENVRPPRNQNQSFQFNKTIEPIHDETIDVRNDTQAAILKIQNERKNMSRDFASIFRNNNGKNSPVRRAPIVTGNDILSGFDKAVCLNGSADGAARPRNPMLQANNRILPQARTRIPTVTNVEKQGNNFIESGCVIF